MFTRTFIFTIIEYQFYIDLINNFWTRCHPILICTIMRIMLITELTLGLLLKFYYCLKNVDHRNLFASKQALPQIILGKMSNC